MDKEMSFVNIKNHDMHTQAEAKEFTKTFKIKVQR